jgi:hypothetical protein
VTIQISARIARNTAVLYAYGDSTVTWDHLDIGWWVRWTRSPDVYPARFMRLLQLGNLTADVGPLGSSDAMARGFMSTPVATLVESNPETVARILDRAGLPCVGCSAMPSETLAEALVLHGVGQQEKERLLHDLGALFPAMAKTSNGDQGADWR